LVFLDALGFSGEIPEGSPEKPNRRVSVFLAAFGFFGTIHGDFSVFAWFFWMKPGEFDVLCLVAGTLRVPFAA
jgi:hypothetical protein